MSDFSEKLAMLCAGEMALARRDPDRISNMIERLAAALGMTVAVATKGDPKGIDTLLTGAEAYAHAEAVKKAKIVRMMEARHDR